MATTKIYVVRINHLGDPPERRLVRAANSSQAWRHVAESYISADFCSQDELIELAAAGVKVEETETAATTTQPE